jgi:transcriptional regulator with XRE-family HTH domain
VAEPRPITQAPAPVPTAGRPTHGPDQETLGSRLKKARTRTGLTQQQAATHLRIPRSGVADLESGHRKVYALELGLLARIYGENIDTLLAGLAQDTGEQQQ